MRSLIGIVGLGVVAAACAGPSVLVGGESVMPPETPPPVLPLVVLAGDDLTPLIADVTVNGTPLRTDVTGRSAVVWKDGWDEGAVDVEVTADGFHAAAFEVEGIPDDLPFEIRLEPVVLLGSVVTLEGVPIDNVTVDLNGRVAVTDADGEFRFQRATPGELRAQRPAWTTKTAPWDGRISDVEMTLEPRQERALRVNPMTVASSSEWSRMLRLADGTEISAFVLDVKDERGTVHYDTTVDLATEIGAVASTYDVRSALRDLEEHGLYKIARISAFQDDPLARAQSDLAVLDREAGGVWQTRNAKAWLDPTDTAAWEYPIALAEEACRLGFDEVQFDDARFPTGGSVATMSFDDESFEYGSTAEYLSEVNQEIRVGTIAAFLSQARDRLNPLGCAVAANVFSITFHSRSDEGVGQLPGALSQAADVLSPMIYSYNYSPGYNDYVDPNQHAPEIVGQVLDTGLTRLEGLAIVRPWVQRAFLESQDILEVQSKADERGLGWMLWSESSSYDRTFLRPAE